MTGSTSASKTTWCATSSRIGDRSCGRRAATRRSSGCTVTVEPLGDMPAIRALAHVCVSHGFTHVGEIELAKTLVG